MHALLIYVLICLREIGSDGVEFPVGCNHALFCKFWSDASSWLEIVLVDLINSIACRVIEDHLHALRRTLTLQYEEATNFRSSWDSSGRDLSRSMFVMPKMHGAHLQHSFSKGNDIK